MKISSVRTDIFPEGGDLMGFIAVHIRRLKENSILIVTSKIVALAERRTANYIDEQAKERLIRAESELAIPTEYCWLTVKDGIVMASAGIDESNADGKLILLPRDSYQTAQQLWKILRRKYRLKRLGVVITDSRVIPLRAGVMGVALGYAGFRGLRNYIGEPDIFGRKFKMTRTNIADSLAVAAVLLMGEGNEQQPLAVIENAPVEFCEQTQQNELRIEPQDDMYRPFFDQLGQKKVIEYGL